MTFYRDRILPYLQNLTMRNRELLPYRERVAGTANGRVLDNGFAMAHIETGYMKGPKPMTFLYEGCAKPA